MTTYIINIYGMDLCTPFSLNLKFMAESYNEALHKAKGMAGAYREKMQPSCIDYNVLALDSLFDTAVFDRDFA